LIIAVKPENDCVVSRACKRSGARIMSNVRYCSLKRLRSKKKPLIPLLPLPPNPPFHFKEKPYARHQNLNSIDLELADAHNILGVVVNDRRN
jgi:hypothetical protein